MFGRLRHPAAFPRLGVLPGFSLLAVLLFALSAPEAARTSPRQPAPQSQDALTLEPGKPIERELKGGETHRYAMTLAAGQHVRVGVQQFGFRIILTLLAPNQEKIFEFSTTTTGGEQIAFLVADQTGNYYVQLRAESDDAKPTRCILQISELRAATIRDRERLAVQKAYEAAHQLPRPRALDTVQDSVKKFEAALLLSQKSEDPELEALILHELGWRHSFDVHNELKAIECFERAFQLRRALGHKQEQAIELYSLGYSHYMLGQLAQARDCYQQAIPIFREAGNRVSEGIVWYRLGVTYFRESLEQTITYYQQAELLLHSSGDVEMETTLQYELAVAWLFLGEPEHALAACYKALALAEHLPLSVHKGNALINLSRTHQSGGDYQKALDASYQALAIFKSIEHLEGETRVTYALASQYLELGEVQRAVEFYQHSISLHQRLGYDARGLRPQAELVQAYCQLGQYQTARDYALSILPLTRKYHDKLSEGKALEALGQAYQALGEHREASEIFGQAAALFREVPFPTGEARVIYARGQAYASQHDFPKALEIYRQSLSLARKLNNPLVEVQSLMGIARAELKREDLTEARANLDASLRIVESVRGRVASPALRASFLATQRSSYEIYLALLMQLHRQQPTAGHAARALEISERARARSLLELLAEAPANIREGVDPALLNRERELRRKLSAKSAAQNRAASQTEEQAATFSRELSSLTAELEQAEAQIRAASPRYAALAEPQSLRLAEIQRQLDADTLLLEYALGAEQSFLFAVTGRTLKSYELPGREVIEGAARRYYELLTARSRAVKFEEPAERAARVRRADADLSAAGFELSRLILQPVAAELGDRRLLIVADGVLQLIPFAALPAPEPRRESVAKNPASDRLLLDHHVISYLPSATVLAQLRRDVQGREPAPQTLAVFADPVFETDDERLPKAVRDQFSRERQTPLVAENRAVENRTAAPPPTDDLTRAIRHVGAENERGGLARLPHTREEANALLALAPPSASFAALDFEATQEAALNPALSRYRYVHFATHGLLDSLHPELSGLVLSRLDPQGRARDGHLRLVEIYGLKLPADLVVLSACKSGLGREVRGEGLLSLTRGFMQAGAARVAVSLWDVNDRSTASLMREFYRGLLHQKLSPAAALRAAQLQMRQSAAWSSPYFWAAFALHGEPR
jgi:CHAT domain-containing protein